jgi:hypothetical protein
MSDYDVRRDESLRLQVNNAYRPIDLFDNEKDCFFCPKCNKQLLLSSARYAKNKFNKSLVKTSCSECRGQLYFKLPEIKKKRVYLDQSVISRLHNINVVGNYKIGSDDWRERLLTKVFLAKKLQKASFIVSEIHVFETVPTRDLEIKESLWRFANSLADGRIGGNFIDAFEYELNHILSDQLKTRKSPLNSYMDFEIDAWSIHSPILMTNSWLLRLHHNRIDFKNASTENFKKILETQKNQVGLDATVENCIEHLKNLYLNGITDGIKYALDSATKRQVYFDWYKSIQNNIETSTPKFIDNSINKNEYADIIFQTTLDYQNTSNQIKLLLKLLERVELQGINAFPSTKMQAVLEGEVLHRWVRGLQPNPARFNENFGSSKFMDITHIAVYLPVVDVLTVDRETYNRCQQPEIRSEIDNYSCKLFRTSNTELGLEKWLDDLLAEPETDEFKCTRRLFFGRNLAEEKFHDDQFISQILDRLEITKQPSA